MRVMMLAAVRDRALVGLGLVAAALSMMSAACAETYSMFVVPDAKFTQPMSINNSGTITGNYWDQKGNRRGFVRAADGTITLFDAKQAKNTWPVAIDRDGTIVGTYAKSDFSNHGFVRKPDGKLISFDPPKSRDTFVDGVAGDIVGTYEPKKGALGFLRTKRGAYLTFKYPGHDTTPNGINSAGEVVGPYWSKDGTKTHGFLRHPDGTFEHIVANGPTWPIAINASGVIVGDNAYEGVFVRSPDGTFATIKIDGADDTEAVGINAGGVVAGNSHSGDGAEHGFTWTAKQGIVLIDVPGAARTLISGINDDGVTVGTCVFLNGQEETGAAFVRMP